MRCLGVSQSSPVVLPILVWIRTEVVSLDSPPETAVSEGQWLYFWGEVDCDL